MRKSTLFIFAAFCRLASADDIDKKPHELNQWNSLQARYKIHSGSTAYSEPPTKTDSVFTAAFRDEAARQLFEQIGPDVKPVCSDAAGDRVRLRKAPVPHLNHGVVRSALNLF